MAREAMELLIGRLRLTGGARDTCPGPGGAGTRRHGRTPLRRGTRPRAILALVEVFPLFLLLEGRAVVVVGAGSVAERKVLDLLAAGAHVTCVAPRAAPPLEELARCRKITWEARPFAPGDLDGAWLAFAATDDASVQRAVASAAEERRVFLVAVDDVPNASAYSGSILRRPPYVVAISSGGEAPALTRLLREILEAVLPGEDWIAAAQALRAKWKHEGTPVASRFGELVRAFKGRSGE